jgi:DNA-binding beta-propeller fold protein YncE
LNGTISGWAGGLSSTIEVTTTGAVYTGLAINTAGTRLYVADSAGGRINVLDSSLLQ